MIEQLPGNLLLWINSFGAFVLTWFSQFGSSALPWINQYGAFALFFLLALGIIALPIPDETLLVASGFLISQGDMHALPTIVAAITGAWTGITVSYFLGVYLGPYILQSKLGKWLGLKSTHLQKAQNWFTRIGKWSLCVGYFIPGVRHFVGYVAGALAFPYYQFSLFAYTGGAIWSSLFLAIGYYKGNTILQFFSSLWNAITHLF
jgi:membrane protein DedA with SNARE-associated domain